MTAEDRPASEASTDGLLRQLLADSRTVAVVGIKDAESEDAYRVPRYLQAHGKRILPVNPKLSRVLGERAYASLGEIDEPVDLVDLFRAPDHIPAHVEEILAMSPLPRVVWMQLGIVHGGAAVRLRAAGIQVVQDRCIIIEHQQLFPDR